MKTRFYIEKRNDESGKLLVNDRPVFMSISFSGKRVVIGTGIKVDIHGWDSELQRVKANFPGSYAVNSWFETLVDIANITLKALRNSQDEVTTSEFQEKFKELKPKYSTGFFDVFYRFMEANSPNWSSSTYRKVRTIYKHLREFDLSADYRIAFNNLNALFLEKFTSFLAEKGNSKATTYKAVSTVVWFLNWATDHQYNVYRDYRNFYKALAPFKDTTRVPAYLIWDELLTIRNFNPINRRMERVRDMFCFMCFSGIRYSELQALKKEDITNEEVIIRKKTRNLRRVPLNNHSMEIYKGYVNKYYLNNTAFPTMSVITMNKYLRIIGRQAGLDRRVPKGNVDGEMLPLYEQLTSGMAIATFIANAVELKVPGEIISNFTGVRNDSRVRNIKLDMAREEIKKFDIRTSGIEKR